MRRVICQYKTHEKSAVHQTLYAVESAFFEPRDLGLGYADGLSGLDLGRALEKSQIEDIALAREKIFHSLFERQLVEPALICRVALDLLKRICYIGKVSAPRTDLNGGGARPKLCARFTR